MSVCTRPKANLPKPAVPFTRMIDFISAMQIQHSLFLTTCVQRCVKTNRDLLNSVFVTFLIRQERSVLIPTIFWCWEDLHIEVKSNIQFLIYTFKTIIHLIFYPVDTVHLIWTEFIRKLRMMFCCEEM